MNRHRYVSRRCVSAAVRALKQTERLVHGRNRSIEGYQWTIDDAHTVRKELPVLSSLPDTYEKIRSESVSFTSLVRAIPDPEQIDHMLPELVLKVMLFCTTRSPSQVLAQVVIKALQRFMDRSEEMTVEAYASFTFYATVLLLSSINSQHVRVESKKELLSLMRKWVSIAVRRICSDRAFVSCMSALVCSRFLIAQAAARISSKKARSILYDRLLDQMVLITASPGAVSNLLLFQTVTNEIPTAILNEVMNSHQYWTDADIVPYVQDFLWNGIQLDYDFPMDFHYRLLQIFKESIRTVYHASVSTVISKSAQIFFHYSISDPVIVNAFIEALLPRKEGITQDTLVVVFVSLANTVPGMQLRRIFYLIEFTALSPSSAVNVLHASAICKLSSDKLIKVVVGYLTSHSFSSRQLCRVFLSLAMMKTNNVDLPETADYDRFQNRNKVQEYYEDPAAIETCLEQAGKQIASHFTKGDKVLESHLFDLAETADILPEAISDDLREAIFEIATLSMKDKEAFQLLRIVKSIPDAEEEVVKILLEAATSNTSVLSPQHIIQCWKFYVQLGFPLTPRKVTQLIKLIRPAVSALDLRYSIDLVAYIARSLKTTTSNEPVLLLAKNLATFVRNQMVRQPEYLNISPQQKATLSNSYGSLGLDTDWLQEDQHAM